MRFTSLLAGICLISASLAQASLPIGQVPPEIELSGSNGGTISGEAWSSKSLATAGKVHMVVYSTASEKDANNDAAEAVKKEDFPTDKFASIAVVNMKSSWQPNYFIDKAIKSKQEQFPKTLYVRDLNRVLVDKWKLADKSNDIVVFDKTGKVVFSVDGALSAKQKDELLAVIKEHIKK
jgi:uncharacterized protein